MISPESGINSKKRSAIVDEEEQEESGETLPLKKRRVEDMEPLQPSRTANEDKSTTTTSVEKTPNFIKRSGAPVFSMTRRASAPPTNSALDFISESGQQTPSPAHRTTSCSLPPSPTTHTYNENISNDTAHIWQKHYHERERGASSTHDISILEKHFYYFNIRGDGQRGPKLVYRTSQDVFVAPKRAEDGYRTMKLLEVTSHPKLGMDNLWSEIRDEIAERLLVQNILFTSIDLVSFGWDEYDAEGQEISITSAVTIWVGVQENSTSSDIAFKFSNEILELLQHHDVDDVEVAFRESAVRLLANHCPLFAPVEDNHPLKDILHSVTTALSLPIAWEKTLEYEGSMGFYFHSNDQLYGVTARHVLFPKEDGNEEYISDPQTKRNVVVMGAGEFYKLLAYAETELNKQIRNASVAMRDVKWFSPNSKHADNLARAKADLDKANNYITALREFLANMKKDEWSKPDNRVIGHVVWAPPITYNTAPHGFTTDICVIQLNKNRFWPNFVANAINLGQQISPAEFTKMMKYRGSSHGFQYPASQRLFRASGIFPGNEFYPHTAVDDGTIPKMLVIKNGIGTRTTIGRCSRFLSKIEWGENNLTVEVPVFSFGLNKYFDAFSRQGDSGSAAFAPDGRLVGLIVSGSGPVGSVSLNDVTYMTPIYWLWNQVILSRFSGASLDFVENYDQLSLPPSSAHTHQENSFVSNLEQ